MDIEEKKQKIRDIEDTQRVNILGVSALPDLHLAKGDSRVKTE